MTYKEKESGHMNVILLSNQWKITAVDVMWAFLIGTIFALAKIADLWLWRPLSIDSYLNWLLSVPLFQVKELFRKFTIFLFDLEVCVSVSTHITPSVLKWWVGTQKWVTEQSSVGICQKTFKHNYLLKKMLELLWPGCFNGYFHFN